MDDSSSRASLVNGFNGAALFRARRSSSFGRRIALCSASFNGAALFRARRCSWRIPRRTVLTRFNGAALFRARRYRTGSYVLHRLLRLQRSRALSSAEIKRRRKKTAAKLAELQRSRALSSAEMSWSGGPTTARPTLQRSRALSSAEIVRRPMPSTSTVYCFNGAALFRARRCETRRPSGLSSRSFNGAALFRARRSDPSRQRAHRSKLLQRSRALSSAEMMSCAPQKRSSSYASTEPRSFERGDGGASCEARSDRFASTEPRSFERGDDLKRVRGRRAKPASTEPRSFERGDRLSPRCPPAFSCRFNGAALFRARRSRPVFTYHEPALFASTEPRSFERGDATRRSPRPPNPTRFNGAALFRARRSRLVEAGVARADRFNGAALFRARRLGAGDFGGPGDFASTEPRSFERGDFRSVPSSSGSRPLQRSRALSSAEMSSPSSPTMPKTSLQRSRALSSAEICADCRKLCIKPLRFNGAALFRARRWRDGTGERVASGTASTEPRSFERGDDPSRQRAHRSKLLQRSRALSSAEIRRGLCVRSKGQRFNGAALFRARRSGHCFRLDATKSMLQRSRALSSAEMSPRGRHEHLQELASTEPRSFERGDEKIVSARTSIDLLQRSRALSSAEIDRPLLMPVDQRSFNGAALFRARR